MADDGGTAESSAIRSYGLTVKAEEEAARQPAPRPPDPPWAAENPVVIVEPAGALLNIPMVKRLCSTDRWHAKYDLRLTSCGISWIPRDGGQFAHAESVAALFDAGILVADKVGRLRIATCRSLDDFEPLLPHNAQRGPEDVLYNAFTKKLYPERVLGRMSAFATALPSGGCRKPASRGRIEDLLPCEIGFRTDTVGTAEGGLLWIRYL